MVSKEYIKPNSSFSCNFSRPLTSYPKKRHSMRIPANLSQCLQKRRWGKRKEEGKKWNKLGWTDTQYIPATSSPFLFFFHLPLSKQTISTCSQRIFIFIYFFIITNKLHVHTMGFKSTTSPSIWIIAHWQLYKLSNNNKEMQPN